MSAGLARETADLRELLDDPDLPEADRERALSDIAALNRILGAHRLAIDEIADLARVAARDGRGPVTILDAGCGAGDLAVALAAWGRRARIPVRVLALDASRTACRMAALAAAADPSIEVLRGDLLRPPLAAGSVDIVHAGLVLHHVPREEQAAFLRRLAALPRVGLVVTDLRRGRIARVAARVLARALRRGRVVRHDAPASVARALSLAQARSLAAATALRGLRCGARGPGRLAFALGPLPRRAEP